MRMRFDFVRFAVVGGVLLLGGCRFKGVESFETATTPVVYPKVPGDKYGNGGIAYATAGVKPETRYGLGSDPNSPLKVDSKMDRPAMGSGQEPGEQGGDAAPGHDQSNAPANQPAPSVDSQNSH